MIKQYTYDDITWYDLESPTEREIEKLAMIYRLDLSVQEELLSRSLKPKVDAYDEYLYVILHFPALRPALRNTNREIDFVVGQKFIITTHYDSLDPLHKFVGIFGAEDAGSAKNAKVHGGHIFFQMIRHLYQSLLSELEILENVLVKAENHLFDGEEKGMLIALSKMSRDLLDFKSATNLHKSVLESYQKEALIFFDNEYKPFSEEMMNEFLKIHSSIQDSKEFLDELRRTNDSLLSNKQNEIMKTVTVLAFIFLPLSLIASVFGMNIDNMPIVSGSNAFPIITGGMLLIALIILSIARYKEWL